MRELIYASLFVYSLVSSTQIWAMSCKDLFISPKKVSSLRSENREINARVQAVTSPEALAKFFEELGGIGEANREYAEGMARLFFHELGPHQSQQIVKNLLLTHRHRAQEAVFSALIAYFRGDHSGATYLAGVFPRPFREKTFLRWHNLGESLLSNKAFLDQLEIAIFDYKNFEYVYGSQIRADRAFSDLKVALKGLNSPSLVGQFMEHFLKSDRLTRQYIVDSVVEFKAILGQTGLTLAIKGDARTEERNATANSIASLVAKSSDRLQEDAYFSYTSNGVSNRPQLPEVETSKKVALRFLQRKKYDLTDINSNHAVKFLLDYPMKDRAVDAALRKIWESGSHQTDGMRRYSANEYAFLELSILTRNAQGLSAIKIDLRYTRDFLSQKTPYLRYLKDLLEFHAKHDLQGFPGLKEIALEYFRKFPESLDALKENQRDNVERLKRDFGI